MNDILEKEVRKFKSKQAIDYVVWYFKYHYVHNKEISISLKSVCNSLKSYFDFSQTEVQLIMKLAINLLKQEEIDVDFTGDFYNLKI